LGVDRGIEQAQLGAAIPIPRWYRPVLKYVAPLYLLAVFGAFCFTNLTHWVEEVARSPVRQAAVLLIAVTLATTLVAIRFGKLSCLVSFDKARLRARSEGV